MTSSLQLDPPAGTSVGMRATGELSRRRPVLDPVAKPRSAIPAGMGHERQADCARGEENSDYGRYSGALQYPRQTQGVRDEFSRSEKSFLTPLRCSDLLRLFNDPHDAPRLRLRELARRLD